MKSSFVYRWREHSTGRWYIGYHTGTPDDGYICSSSIVKPLIQNDPTNWSRRILRTGTKQQMIDLERRLLTRLQARTNARSYNRSNGNGTIRGGRTQGTDNRIYQQHPDFKPAALRQLNSDQLVEKFLNSVGIERFLMHKYFSTILTG